MGCVPVSAHFFIGKTLLNHWIWEYPLVPYFWTNPHFKNHEHQSTSEAIPFSPRQCSVGTNHSWSHTQQDWHQSARILVSLATIYTSYKTEFRCAWPEEWTAGMCYCTLCVTSTSFQAIFSMFPGPLRLLQNLAELWSHTVAAHCCSALTRNGTTGILAKYAVPSNPTNNAIHHQSNRQYFRISWVRCLPSAQLHQQPSFFGVSWVNGERT